MTVVYLNGELLPEAEARVSPLDRGFLLGDGVFETLRVDSGRPRHFTEHLARLKGSAEATGIPLPEVDLARAVRDVVEANGLARGTARVRITLTRGPGTPGPATTDAGPSTLLVTASPLHLNPKWYAEGVTAVTARTRRQPPGVLDPAVKSTSYLPLVLAHREAEAAGAFEALLLDVTCARVVEATAANVFLVKDGRLATPDLESGCLPGVTRERVLRLAKAHSLPADERPVSPGELATVDEFFLTSSGLGVVPVTRIDARVIGDGNPGPWTRRLHDALEQSG